MWAAPAIGVMCAGLDLTCNFVAITVLEAENLGAPTFLSDVRWKEQWTLDMAQNGHFLYRWVALPSSEGCLLSSTSNDFGNALEVQKAYLYPTHLLFFSLPIRQGFSV